MYRKHLDDDAGMIFVFKGAAPRNFWMHNTVIPLDMIFADSSGRVIGIVANAEPFSDKLLGVDGDSAYVLEVNGGFCAKNGIKAGDRLDFRDLRRARAIECRAHIRRLNFDKRSSGSVTSGCEQENSNHHTIPSLNEVARELGISKTRQKKIEKLVEGIIRPTCPRGAYEFTRDQMAATVTPMES